MCFEGKWFPSCLHFYKVFLWLHGLRLMFYQMCKMPNESSNSTGFKLNVRDMQISHTRECGWTYNALW